MPIVPTPFTDAGEVDLASLDSVVDYLVAAGVAGLAVLGMASECFMLTGSERRTVIESVAKRLDGKLPLVAGCSHHSAFAAARQAAAAEQSGADMLMVMPPNMSKPEPSGILDYYAAIDGVGRVPIMVQDNPGWTGVTIPTNLYERLAELDRVRYAKVETSHPPTSIRSIRDAVGDRLILFGGLGGNWLAEEVASGTAGTMPASIMPQVYVHCWQLWSAGETAKARAVFHRYHPAIRVSGHPTVGIAMAKYLLWTIGVLESPDVRPPMRALTTADRADLEKVCDELDLLAIMRGERVVAADTDGQ